MIKTFQGIGYMLDVPGAASEDGRAAPADEPAEPDDVEVMS